MVDWVKIDLQYYENLESAPQTSAPLILTLLKSIFILEIYIALKEPSIYDVHTEGEGSDSGGRMWAVGGGSSPMWTSTQKIKIRVH